MKRIIAILLTCAMVLGLCACGSKAPTWQEQYDLGVKYLSEGNYAEAIIAFTAAIEIDPKQALAYVGRGNAYIGSGETEETLTAALADYEEAAALDETNVLAYLGMADVYIRLGSYDKAMEVLRLGLEKTGDQTIADKLDEMERGVYMDSTQKIRRSNSYNMEGELVSYTEYEYDAQGRKVGWTNYARDDGEGGLLDEFYLENYCQVTFDAQGRPERNQFYTSDGTPTSYDTFAYNAAGLKERQDRYYVDGRKIYFLFYYDDAGRRTKYEGYDAEGLYAYWISEYDENGDLIKETHYDKEGNVQFVDTFE